MKKALLSLLVLALVMIPVLVSCEDTSQIEKIGQLMLEFSGVGKVSPEQAKKQTEQATSQIEEKFKEENLENLKIEDFKEISNMFYDFPAADLENTKTSIDKGKLNKLISESIPKETQTAMTEAKSALDEMVSNGDLKDLGLPDEVAEGVIGKITGILGVFSDITGNTSDTEKASLKDVKEASAAASMYGELAEIAGKFTGMMGEGSGSTSEPTEEETMQLVSDLMTGLDNYNNAAKAYAETVGKDASEFTIDLESLAGQFLGEM